MNPQPGSTPLTRPEPIIRVEDIAYVMFEKPDLDQAERFLADFGLVRVQRDERALYMRAAGTLPFAVAVRRGETARYLGAGFCAASRADLERLASATKAAIEPSHHPGGGDVVALTDPGGFRVEIVHGARPATPLPLREQPLPLNTPLHKVRVNQTQRPETRPAAVFRLGHLVLEATDFAASAAWYMRHLGLIPTDVQCLVDGTPNLAFMRCDRGARPADHHTVVVFGGVNDAYGHSAYEVLDLDEVGMGQQILKAGGWKHVWGIGRHILGSQIFDYWKDGDGMEMEHYADGDVFDASHPTAYHSFDPSLLWMWGQDLPADFGPKRNASALIGIVARLLRGRVSLDHLRLLMRSTARPARPWLAKR